MKKVLFILTMVVLASCSNNTTTVDVDSLPSDSLNCDSAKCDTMSCDSTK